VFGDLIEFEPGSEVAAFRTKHAIRFGAVGVGRVVGFFVGPVVGHHGSRLMRALLRVHLAFNQILDCERHKHMAMMNYPQLVGFLKSGR
jgi:hypothetical protein